MTKKEDVTDEETGVPSSRVKEQSAERDGKTEKSKARTAQQLPLSVAGPSTTGSPKETEEGPEVSGRAPTRKFPLVVTETIKEMNGVSEEERERAERAWEHIEVEDTYVPDKPFFTPNKVEAFLDNLDYLDHFDTFLTMQLLISVSDLLEKEDNLVRTDDRTTMFVGDIHGDHEVLDRILRRFRGSDEIARIVLLGDYVDRGKDSIKVVNRLFLEKLSTPDEVVILRGNHEIRGINVLYGLFSEVEKRFLKQHRVKVFAWYNEIFGLLPFAALLDGRTLAVHGGIPRSLKRIERINELVATPEMTDNEILLQLLWNGPTEEDPYFAPAPRGEGIWLFGRKAFDSFMSDNGLNTMIIAHEYLERGYRYYFEERLLQLFSGSDYLEKGNKGAFALLDPEDNLKIERIGN